MYEFRPHLEQLHRSVQQAVEAVRSPATGPIGEGLKQAAAFYLAFIRRRFDRASKGDGTWPDLAPSTKLARMRKTQKGRKKLAASAKKRGRLRKQAAAMRKRVDRIGGAAGAAMSDQIDRWLMKEIGRISPVALARFSILRDTGLLSNSLSLGGPGNVQTMLSDGIQVGTQINYARFHQQPSVPGQPPQRPIFVDPDNSTAERMRKALSAAVLKAINGGH